MSLLKIAPLTKTVTVSGGTIEVRGISAKAIANLIFRFPAIQRALDGGRLDRAALIKLVPDAVAAIIAAAVGAPGDQATEDDAALMSIGDQLDVLNAVFEATFPNGTAPLTALFGKVGLDLAAGDDKPSAETSQEE
jgi:hypothetical protein